MQNVHFLLGHISNLMKIGIFQMQNEELVSFNDHMKSNPISQSEALQARLKNGADRQEEPYIFQDQFDVFFTSIRDGETYYMLGPMNLKLSTWPELRQYYKYYEIPENSEKRLKCFTLSEVLDFVETTANIILQKEYSDEELLYANEIIVDTRIQEKREQILFDIKESEEERYHHTYQEERKLLDSVRDGATEEALRYSRNMDAALGKLSAKESNHWKNVAIAAITLCTRAAIDGGISPSAAYRISDFYIQKVDGCREIAGIIKYRNFAIEELTEQVQKKQKSRTSNHVERCKDYVSKNYRKKIYLSDIAESLGLSETYLSRLFKKETGISLQDYIVEIRLDHAANLLKYSKESISDIAEYVNFPSQSYMGKVFKERYQLSPKKYREHYATAEYFDE